jgi:hypothetical protein
MYENAHDPSATFCRETKRPCTPCSAREPSFWPLQLMRIEGGICHHLSCISLPAIALSRQSLTQAFVWSITTPVKDMHAGPFPAAYHTGAHRCREQEALHILTSVYAAVVCISQQPLETPNALVCCVKQALILIWVTNKVTTQPSHVLTALPMTAP